MKKLSNKLHKPAGKSHEWWLNYYQDRGASPEQAMENLADNVQEYVDSSMTESGTGLSMAFHNNVQLDRAKFIASGGKDIQMTKTYKFAEGGGSVQDSKNTILGQL